MDEWDNIAKTPASSTLDLHPEDSSPAQCEISVDKSIDILNGERLHLS